MSENKEYTDIEVLVFEDDDGHEVEMNIVDEFDYGGASYIALVAADAEEGDDISVYRVLGDDNYEQIDDPKELDALLDAIEARIVEKY